MSAIVRVQRYDVTTEGWSKERARLVAGARAVRNALKRLLNCVVAWRWSLPSESKGESGAPINAYRWAKGRALGAGLWMRHTLPDKSWSEAASGGLALLMLARVSFGRFSDQRRKASARAYTLLLAHRVLKPAEARPRHGAPRTRLSSRA